MNFLQAHATLKAFTGGPLLPLLVGMSGTGEPMEIYLRAAAAEHGREARVRFLPFGTLAQALLSPPARDEREALLLMPWDLVPELDWRTGVASAAPDPHAVREAADAVVAQLATRGAALLYLDTAGAPLWLEPSLNASLQHYLRSVMEGLGAVILPASSFALGAYLSSGQPIGPKELGAVAREIVQAALSHTKPSAKVLVTDLDHTLWHGIIGDDGIGGIYHRPEGKGYRHFVYQSLLRRLRQDGVLLAAVSKNDATVAREPFVRGDMLLREDDFVAIVASWEPKSVQIEMLAEQLNLGLDAFVFVDDNPVELAEVSSRLPSVACVEFPSGEQGLPALIETLVTRFQRSMVTAEDRERTALYRRRVSTLPPREGSASDIREFLRGLEMSLLIEERTTGDRTRAVQLINKTNQFNVNGLRLEDAEVARLLAEGSRLFTATLSDRSGDHGQILAALIGADGTLSHLVMSCRVFQRRVEHAFFAWLAANGVAPRAVAFRGTERNEPARRFLEECAGEAVHDGLVSVREELLRTAFADDLTLFSVRAPVMPS